VTKYCANNGCGGRNRFTVERVGEYNFDDERMKGKRSQRFDAMTLKLFTLLYKYGGLRREIYDGSSNAGLGCVCR